ncbi:MAG: D-2-hydroxyacid dehydrogenase [Lentisphaeria bacterium]|nr:D-2-hydroxyacid dehydrogenase [Lentisphaeria bacterium]
MKKRPGIVILDGNAANPGDLSWEELEELGCLTVYPHVPATEEELLERSRDAEIILLNKVPFSADLLKKLPALKLISVQATGYDLVDVKAARALGITVCNAPAYSTCSVVQQAFSLLLELVSSTGKYSDSVHRGDWAKAPDFTYSVAPIRELAGLTFGIFGFGAIGQKAACAAKAFGMRVIVCTRTHYPGKEVEYVTKEELFRQSDVVSLHCPLTEETRKLVCKETLSLMKKSAYLINTGRGGLVDEEALAEALNTGKIAGAGLDVLQKEPPETGNVLVSAKNTVITPHVAWASKEARKRLIHISAENVRCFLEGHPINVVN